ncbi:MAG: hypothetical protein IT372_36710 [Polyangiaceae bacterium]|nr:hypothetical protein [Polyangiaceae bacterium]
MERDRYIMWTRAHLGRALLSVSCISLLTGVAHANDRDVRATTIPAAACRPEDSYFAAQVRLDRAAWVFRPGVTGLVILHCPLGINQYTVSDDTNDNDITRIRVHYLDSDGRGERADLTVALQQWPGDLRLSVAPAWVSSESGGARGWTVDNHDIPHDLQSDSLYSFVVVMYRRSAEDRVGFAGIEFPILPRPLDRPVPRSR